MDVKAHTETRSISFVIQPISKKQKVALQSMVVLQVLFTVIVTVRRFSGLDIMKAGRWLDGWEFWIEASKSLQVQWVLVALVVELILVASIAAGKQWVWPFILILLVDASLYQVWASFPWVWVYRDSTSRLLGGTQSMVLLLSFVALFWVTRRLEMKRLDNLRVGVSTLVALSIIYIKGRFSFCCPQYGSEPPDWWVYAHISDLWDPQEVGLLVCWASYASVLSLSRLVSRTLVVSR